MAPARKKRKTNENKIDDETLSKDHKKVYIKHSLIHRDLLV